MENIECDLQSYSWSTAVEERQHKHPFSAAPCSTQQVSTSGVQDLCNPHTQSWPGVSQL